MAAGGPGDHPLTDVLVHNLDTYGKEADQLLKELSLLMPWHELANWFDKEISWNCTNEQALAAIKKELSIAQVRTGNN